MTRRLTARKVAAVLGVSPETVLRYCCVGQPGFRVPSGQLRFHRRPCGCRRRLAGAEPLKPAREVRFELTPTMRCSGEAHPYAIESPATVATERVSTRWARQLWCRDHDSVERWTARAAGARISRARYGRPGRWVPSIP